MSKKIRIEIDGEEKFLHKSVLKLALLMQGKLDTRQERYPEISGKDNWLALDVEYLEKHFSSEIEEFKNEVEKFKAIRDSAGKLEIRKNLKNALWFEAADVANLAFMIVTNIEEKLDNSGNSSNSGSFINIINIPGKFNEKDVKNVVVALYSEIKNISTMETDRYKIKSVYSEEYNVTVVVISNHIGEKAIDTAIANKLDAIKAKKLWHQGQAR